MKHYVVISLVLAAFGSLSQIALSQVQPGSPADRQCHARMMTAPFIFNNIKTCAAITANSRWINGWHDRARIRVWTLDACWEYIDDALAIDSDGCWPENKDDFFKLIDQYISTGIDAGIQHGKYGQ